MHVLWSFSGRAELSVSEGRYDTRHNLILILLIYQSRFPIHHTIITPSSSRSENMLSTVRERCRYNRSSPTGWRPPTSHMASTTAEAQNATSIP